MGSLSILHGTAGGLSFASRPEGFATCAPHVWLSLSKGTRDHASHQVDCRPRNYLGPWSVDPSASPLPLRSLICLGTAHRRQRKIMSPAFFAPQLRTFLPLFQESALKVSKTSGCLGRTPSEEVIYYSSPRSGRTRSFL